MGTDGPDSIDGTNDQDVIQGLGGDDTLNGLNGDDLLDGGDGNDQLSGGYGDDILTGGSGQNTLDGGNGRDFVDFTAEGPISGALNGAVTTTIGSNLLVAIDGVLLGAGDDIITGSHRNATVYDAGGDNFFDMGKGSDSIWLSGSGSSTVFGGAGRDTIHGGDGDDQLYGGNDLNTIDGGGGDDVISSSGGELLGNKGRDTFLPGPGLTTIDGGKGFDRIDYSRFDHAISVNLPNQTVGGLHSVANVEQFVGTAFADTMAAGAAPESFLGRDGDDFLLGGSANDTLVGGHGSDTMAGGEGSDVFRFDAVNDSRPGDTDVIRDLTDSDIVDLSGIDADVHKNGNQAFAIVSSFSGHAGELRVVYDSGSDTTFIEGDVNGDGSADLRIELIHDHSTFANLVL